MSHQSNPIYKIASGTMAFTLTHPYKPSLIKQWVAKCPECGKVLTGRYSSRTRKQAKDALYLHLKFNHN